MRLTTQRQILSTIHSSDPVDIGGRLRRMWNSWQMSETEALPLVEIVPYDPRWPYAYAAEHAELIAIGGSAIVELEHIGSTSVPGLSAKPIIDMMAAVTDLEIGHALVERLEGHGYRLIKTGMPNRLFLRRPSAVDCSAFQLHIVEQSTWDERNERLMRDYLLVHSEAVAAYAAIKIQLARDYAEDSLAYTKAKTAFIQKVVDKARAERGLSPVDVWEV